MDTIEKLAELVAVKKSRLDLFKESGFAEDVEYFRGQMSALADVAEAFDVDFNEVLERSNQIEVEPIAVI